MVLDVVVQIRKYNSYIHTMAEFMNHTRTFNKIYHQHNTMFFSLVNSPQPASYGKKNGMWFSPSANQGWGAKLLSRKQSMVDTELSQGPPLKPSAGRVIRIVNYMDHSVQVRIASTTPSHAHHRTTINGMTHKIKTFYRSNAINIEPNIPKIKRCSCPCP